MKAKKKSKKEQHLVHEARERIDWLTPAGKTIGTVDKKFAHTHGLFHAAAHVYILDEKKRVIFQKRGKWMLLQPGKWDTAAGGHVTAGEYSHDAAIREAEEEMNARGKMSVLGSLDILDRTPAYHNHERITYFVMRTTTPIRYQRSEIEKIERVPLENVDSFLKTRAHTPWLAKSWKKFGKKIARAAK